MHISGLERHQGSTWDGNRFLRLVSAQLARVGITAERRSLRIAGGKGRVVPVPQGGAPFLACATFTQLYVVGVGFCFTEILYCISYRKGGSTAIVQHSSFMECSHRRNVATSHIYAMNGLYRLPIEGGVTCPCNGYYLPSWRPKGGIHYKAAFGLD
jgi:hypothetical protein